MLNKPHKTRKFKVKGVTWVTLQNPTKREVQARRGREANKALGQIISAGAVGLKILLSADAKKRVHHYRTARLRKEPDHNAANIQLE